MTRALAIAIAMSCAFGCGSTGHGDDTSDDSPPTADAPPGTPDAHTAGTPDAHIGGTPDAHTGGTPDAMTAACQSVAGTWVMGGTCGSDVCTFAQTGCAITSVSCNSGAHSTSGSITAGQFAYTGVTGGGAPASCSGNVAAGSMSGTCTVLGNPCLFTGQLQ